MRWVPTMLHALKAEGTTLKKPLQPSGCSFSPSLSQPSAMVLACWCSAILIWTRYFPHIMYFCIFLKSLPCNTNSTASQGCQGEGSANCSPQARLWRREGTKFYHPPHSWLIPMLSFPPTHFRISQKDDRMNDCPISWLCFSLTCPKGGDTVLSFPQMQSKRPIPKNHLSWSFILWRRDHMAVSGTSYNLPMPLSVSYR